MNDYSNKWTNYKKVNMSFDQQYMDDIDTLLNLLHEEQLGMIDNAVDASDLRDARELIEYIKGL
jgi:hypothetical protein